MDPTPPDVTRAADVNDVRRAEALSDGRLTADHTRSADADDVQRAAELSGHRVASTGSRYQLGDEIARGGMGVVMRAWDQTLDREVALKVLAGNLVGTRAAERFRMEAHITARLQHPAIPPVHDLGTTDDGRPFLAMKLIHGGTLDELLHARPAPSHDRGRWLAVFETVAQAVGFAHARGVIHRDLKPLNIMVGAFGEVQVMDWGLAKELTEPADDTPEPVAGDVEHTRVGSVMGTPAYMPPEQARGEVANVDCRSDVFGLGGILCTILTGRPPFVGTDGGSTHRLAASGKLDDAYARLAGCGAEPDLIALATRCLSVDPRDRPADGGEVAEAVRQLRTAAEDRAHEAEMARLAAAVRRRWVVRSAAVVAAILLTGTGVSVWQAVRATDAERATGRQLELTREAEAEARRESASARQAEAEERAARTLADRERLRADKATQKARDEEALAIGTRNFLASVLRQAGSWQQYEDAGRTDPNLTVREALDRAAARVSTEYNLKPQLESLANYELGLAYLGYGAYPQAVKHLERTAELATELYGVEWVETHVGASQLANAYRLNGELTKSEQWYLRTLRRHEADDGPESVVTLQIVKELALLRADQQRPQEAAMLFERAAPGLAKVYGKRAENVLDARMGLAHNTLQAGNSQRAAELYEKLLPDMESALGVEHPRTVFARNGLGWAYIRTGRPERAHTIFHDGLRVLRKVLGPDHPDTLICLANNAELACFNGDIDRGLLLWQEAADRRAARLGADKLPTLYAKMMVGRCHEARREYAEAEAVAGQVLAQVEKNFGQRHELWSNAAFNMGFQFVAQRRFAEAEPWLEKTARVCTEVYGPTHEKTRQAENGWAMTLEQQGRWSAALPLLERLWQYQQTNEPTSWLTKNAASRLGRALAEAGRMTEAERLLRVGHEGLLANAAEIPLTLRGLRLKESAERLARFHTLAGRSAEADRWSAIATTHREMLPLPRSGR